MYQSQSSRQACFDPRCKCRAELARVYSWMPEVVNKVGCLLDDALVLMKEHAADRDRDVGAAMIHKVEACILDLQKDNQGYAVIMAVTT